MRVIYIMSSNFFQHKRRHSRAHQTFPSPQHLTLTLCQDTTHFVFDGTTTTSLLRAVYTINSGINIQSELSYLSLSLAPTLHNLDLVGRVLLNRLVEDVDIPLGFVRVRNVESIPSPNQYGFLAGNRRDANEPAIASDADISNLLVVLLAELDLLEVGNDALVLDTLGDHAVTPVCAPGDEGLSGSGAEARCDFADAGLLRQFREAET